MIRAARFLKIAVACCAAVALAACGANAGGTAGRTGPTGDPVQGGSAKVLQITEPRSMDPATMTNAWQLSGFLGNALYGTLMINDEHTGAITYTMVRSFDTTDNGASFTLKLRPGLTFSDGTPLDAAAVKFNWEHAKDPAVGSAYQPELAMIASTQVVDPTTLLVKMVAPVPNYPKAMLASSMNWIASPTALQAGQKAFDAHPVGAGPYVLKSWTRQDKIELERNPRYWDAPRPYLDSITLRTSNDSGQRYNTLVSGGADAVMETNPGSIAKAAKAGYPTDVSPTSGGLFLAMNLRRAPFDDLKARQAIAAALDMDALNQSVYTGAGQPVRTLFTDTSPLYSDVPLRTPDRATAQRLFDELAAEGKPLSFTFISYASSEMRDTAESVQAQLATYRNVDVKMRVVEFTQSPALQAGHDFDMLVWSANFVDPDPRMMTVFGASSGGNVTGVADPELDSALQAGRAAANPQQLKAAYDVVQKRLTELTPAIFTARVNPGVMAGKNVGGIVQYGQGSLLPDKLWIKK